MIWRSGILTTSNLAMLMDDVVALNVLALFGPKGTHLNADIRVPIRASTIHHILFTAQSPPLSIVYFASVITRYFSIISFSVSSLPP